MMQTAESTSQTDIEQLVKKQKDRLAFLLEGFVILRSAAGIEPWKRKRRIRSSILLSYILTFMILYIAPLLEKNYPTVLRFLQQGVWWLLGGLALLIVSLSVALLLSRRSSQKSKALFDKAIELRTMLGNEELIPLVADQPAIVSQDKLPVMPTSISIKHWKGDAVLKLMGVTPPLVTLLTTILPQLTLQDGAGSSRQAFIFSIIYLIVVLVVCGGFCLAASIFIRQDRRSAGVVVDSYELRGYRPDMIRNSQINIAWDDVQGFYVFIYKGLDRIYFLDGREATFVWGTDHSSSTDLLNASDCLASLIVTYTRLPLRDLSTAVPTLLTKQKN